MEMVPGPPVNPPQDEHRSHQAREDGQRPQKRPDPQADESKRQHERQRPRRIAHEKDAVPFVEAGGLLNPLHCGRIVRIAVVNQLLAGGPKTNEIARRCNFAGQRHDAKEHGCEGKREPGHGRDRKLGEIDARLCLGSNGACHDRYSTFCLDRSSGPRQIRAFLVTLGVNSSMSCIRRRSVRAPSVNGCLQGLAVEAEGRFCKLLIFNERPGTRQWQATCSVGGGPAEAGKFEIRREN